MLKKTSGKLGLFDEHYNCKDTLSPYPPVILWLSKSAIDPPLEALISFLIQLQRLQPSLSIEHWIQVTSMLFVEIFYLFSTYIYKLRLHES